MAAQWAPNHGYAYPNYPQQSQQYQYGPQQYPYPQHGPQIMPSQSYSHPQSGSYQQPYQQPPAPAPTQPYPPQVAQPTPPTCYNCGSPEHWAQHCPEPRREVPAGSLTQSSYPRPNKRQKYSAPVITKYQVPHLHQLFGPPNYGGQLPGQPGYAQHQAPYGPPTPMPAYSHQPPQWVPPPHHQPHQNYQSPYGQNTSYQQQPYAVPPSPAASTAYGPHHQGPIPPQGSHKQAGYFPVHATYQTGHVPQAPLYSSSSPSINGMSSEIKQTEQSRNENGHNVRSNRHDSSDRSVSMQSQTVTPGTHSVTGSTVDADDEDLSTLDIPDIPSYPGPNGETKPQPVGLALPADYYVFESVGGVLPPPEFEADGYIQSVFVTQSTLKNVHQRFVDSNIWEFSGEDPIYRTIRDDGELISLKESLSDLDRQMSIDGDSDSEKEDGEWTRDTGVETKSTRASDIESTAEKSPEVIGYGDKSYISSASKAASPGLSHLNGSSKSQGSPEESIPKPVHDTEGILTALGVTGVPKPIRAHARPYPSSEASRKREFDYRDLSDDDRGTERKRQIDDVTPKLKRRQPKVAAAYDRRW